MTIKAFSLLKMGPKSSNIHWPEQQNTHFLSVTVCLSSFEMRPHSHTHITAVCSMRVSVDIIAHSGSISYCRRCWPWRFVKRRDPTSALFPVCMRDLCRCRLLQQRTSCSDLMVDLIKPLPSSCSRKGSSGWITSHLLRDWITLMRLGERVGNPNIRSHLNWNKHSLNS